MANQVNIGVHIQCAIMSPCVGQLMLLCFSHLALFCFFYFVHLDQIYFVRLDQILFSNWQPRARFVDIGGCRNCRAVSWTPDCLSGNSLRKKTGWSDKQFHSKPAPGPCAIGQLFRIWDFFVTNKPLVESLPFVSGPVGSSAFGIWPPIPPARPYLNEGCHLIYHWQGR